MKYLSFALLLIAFSCSINSEYTTQTETKTVNNNGVRSSVRVTKNYGRQIGYRFPYW
ncbi:hypothetical protein LWM68_42990 [Niabella sp. W65]|nr:hypothetical protein [Niabella sp. W65]MCH7368910.1 hypothetical protein [Niabella sp. W65]